MIFRLSQKLSKKLKIKVAGCLCPPGNPFSDWSANVFSVQRAQYIMLTNTASLYSVVMLGRGIADEGRFVSAAFDSIREFLVADGQAVLCRHFIFSATDTIEFSSALNRSITGSMNDLILNAKLSIDDRGYSPFATGVDLNRMPMSLLGYSNPREAFKALEGKQATSGSVNDDSVC